jgi:Ca-activated chloride channel family protein
MAGKHWLWLTAAAVVAIMAVVAVRSFRPSSLPGQSTPESLPRGALAISIASSNTKEDWLREAVHAFHEASKTNKSWRVNGQPVVVEVLKEVIDGKSIDYRSGTMVSDTVQQKIKPTIISPGEESWLVKFKQEWQLAHNTVAVRGDAPVVVRTPLVVAMWASRATALGCWPTLAPDCTWERLGALAASAEGWKRLGHPEWGSFKFGYGYFGESNSGTLGVLAMCMAGVKKPRGLVLADVGVTNGCGQVIAGVERAKVHSGKSDVWLLNRMIQGGPEYLDAVITYESNVILMNRKHAAELREPLVSVYPQDGTVVVGHPFAILDNTPWVTAEHVQAAKLFGQFLLSPGQQQAVLQVGLRPADHQVKLGPPIEEGLGANPQARLLTLEVPETLVIDRVGEVWRQVKKKAIIAMSFDKSGSMRHEGKIGAAIKGAQEFVRSMELGDQLLWLPFDATVYTRTRGRKSEVGEQLTQEIAATPASGGTALYDAILTAVDEIEKLHKTHADTVRYGIVVLSDGHDTNSKHTLTMLQERLRPQEQDPRGFQIHTICIGSDCDESVLQKIAAAAHGRFWKGKSAADMVKVYTEIATHY